MKIMSQILGVALLTGLLSSYAQTIDKAATPRQAILQTDLCREYFDDRTQIVSLENPTSIGLEIWFVQVKSSFLPNEDFVKDTGVFVGATNEGAPSRYTADPCYAGGSKRPIEGEVCESSAKFNNGQTINFDPIKATPGYYFTECPFAVGYDEKTKELKVTPRVRQAKPIPKVQQ